MLQTIQGRYMPELRIAGVADGMEMMLVTDFVRTDVSQERLPQANWDTELICATCEYI